MQRLVENTVSEETYTEEYNRRKEAEFELYKLQANIDKMIVELESEVFTDAYDGQFVGIEDVKRVINKYCKGDSNEKED